MKHIARGKPIIFLPGWSMNTQMTAYQAEPYFQQRESWQRIYIDPPGHGKSPGKDWITDQDKMLEVILACTDKLTAGQNYCLVGISLGAYLARGVIQKRAKLIDGVALIVPVIIAEDTKRSVPPYRVLVEESLTDANLTPTACRTRGMQMTLFQAADDVTE